MRNSVEGDPAHDASAPPPCDRCGLSTHYSQLVGYPLNDRTYWLCVDCEQAIVVMWLVEHEPGMLRRRQERRP